MSCFLAFRGKDTKTIENLISNHAGIGNSGQDGALPGFCLCAAGEAGRLAQGKFNSREAGNPVTSDRCAEHSRRLVIFLLKTIQILKLLPQNSGQYKEDSFYT